MRACSRRLRRGGLQPPPLDGAKRICAIDNHEHLLYGIPSISEDQQKDAQSDLQEKVDNYNKHIEDLLKEKEKAIMTV